MPEPDRRLWSCLRAHRLNGHSFRRRVPIGPYIAGFLCPRYRLIVEVVDGTDRSRTIAGRDAYLMALGYRLVRVRAAQVMTDLESVLAMIVAELEP